jgi:peptidoglycan-N-acetylglucosamine deacetylase
MDNYRKSKIRPFQILDEMNKAPIKLLLTFDDGPHPVWTARILDLLDSHGVKAIFFCVGSQVKRFPQTTKAIIDRGHFIGNHTWSHNPFLSWMHPKFENEIEDVHNYFINNYNYTIRFFRAPWGILSPKARKYLQSEGKYKILHWDVDLFDYVWPLKRHLSFKDKLGQNTCQILLMHDGSMYSPISSKNHTIKSLRRLLRQKNQDFIFINPEEICKA